MISTLLTMILIGQVPLPRMVEPLPFDPVALAAKPQTTLRVSDGGKPVVYAGVPLAQLLPPKGAGATEMGRIKSLSDAVIVVRCADGYQVAYSAAAVAMDTAGERYLLALTRDGKPLDEGHGPVQMIVPGDPKPVRWCRQVVSARLIRLGTVNESP